MNKLLIFAIAAVIPYTCTAQTPEPQTLAPQTLEPLDWHGKLQFHAVRTYGPLAIVGDAAYAGILDGFHSPTEWGQGATGYARRFGSTVACSAMYNAIGFGLDTALHQDPRYYRSLQTGFWRRAAHAVRGTVLTRTDSGGETLSTWRLGSAYGTAFLSNQWYPDRVNTVRLGFIQGSVTVGFGLASNMVSEFWPEIRRKVLRKK